MKGGALASATAVVLFGRSVSAFLLAPPPNAPAQLQGQSRASVRTGGGAHRGSQGVLWDKPRESEEYVPEGRRGERQVSKEALDRIMGDVQLRGMLQDYRTQELIITLRNTPPEEWKETMSDHYRHDPFIRQVQRELFPILYGTTLED